jgi:predicted nucleotidyltransferase
MGRAFSVEDIQSDRIPTEADFSITASVYESEVRRALGTGALVSSLVYGSVAAGTANARSDFDCLLVYDGTASGYQTCREIIATTTAATNGKVPIETPPYPRSRLALGTHEIDVAFGHHLTTGIRIVRGEDIADYITFTPAPPLVSLNAYLAAKKRSLDERGASPVETDRLRAIQRMLEAPLAVGRKVLKTLDILQGTALCPHNSAAKSEVASAALAVYSRFGIDGLPLQVLFADRYYALVLQAAVEGSVDTKRYTDVLNELDGMVHPVSTWIDQVQQRVPEYLTGKLSA